MKTTKEQLKAIVKEILVEILSEGLGNSPMLEYRQPAPGRAASGRVNEQRQQGQRRPAFDPRLDRPVQQTGRMASDALKEAVRRESHGNPVMADILADTAMTTLPQMLSHGDGGAPTGVGSQQEQFNGAPEEVFGEGASRWADLAFMGDPKNKTA